MSILTDWEFDLPPAQIARRPTPNRTGARLLHLPLDDASIHDRGIAALPDLLRSGDRLVVNDTRVMAARLFGHRATGGRVQFVVLSPGPDIVTALAKPAKKLKLGDVITLESGDTVTITAESVEGVVQLKPSAPMSEIMERSGEMPLPPYMERSADAEDRERYQTIFAGPLGAAAAPTAGLHFDDALIDALSARGIALSRITLHVGLGTSRPLREEDIERGTLHTESTFISETVVDELAQTRRDGGRIIAVGTTSARTLESAAGGGEHRLPTAGRRDTNLFIQPPYDFRVIDGLLTNFHLPRSSLLMLVASLCGKDRLFAAYHHAISSGYRFYSYGDAMLLV